MVNKNPNWKGPYYRALKESVQYPPKKLERERWVVGQLLQTHHILFDEKELVDGEEPVDIGFRIARFQVKELLEEVSRRGDKLKRQTQLIEEAQSPRDLIKEYKSENISWENIVLKVEEEVNCRIAKRYGPNERASLDLLFYFNYSNDEISGPFERVLTKGEGFRSVSLVTNSYRGVLYAAPNAPDFLRTIYGRILE